VKAICERYELPYNAGPFLRQFGGVQRTILRLAFPGGTRRPKPGPFRGDSETVEHPGTSREHAFLVDRGVGAQA
jgi:hypothetical protein